MPVDNSVSSVKFVGIFVDNKMYWERCPHVDYVISGKLFRIIYILKQLKNHIPVNYVRVSYFAFFHSVILRGPFNK